MVTEELTDLLKLAFTTLMSGIHTAIPARVVSYDRATKTVTAKPSIRYTYADGTKVSMPTISQVPVLFPGSSDAVIQWPLVKGDSVLLLFSEASLENWLASTAEEVDPGDLRKYALTDAVCIPGLSPPRSPGKVASTDGLEIRFKTGVITIAPGGNIELNGNTKSLVTHAELNTVLQTFILALNTTFASKLNGAGAPGTLSLDISSAATSKVKV